MKYSITVTLKKDVLDPQGKVVENTLKNMGLNSLKSVRQGKILDIEFKSNNVDMNKIMEMCENFLTNPLVEDYTIEEIINKS